MDVVFFIYLCAPAVIITHPHPTKKTKNTHPPKKTRRSCQRDDGSDDLKKGTQLLEVYAVEIQMHTEQRNAKRLKQLYHKALAVKSAIPHPRILGIIR